MLLTTTETIEGEKFINCALVWASGKNAKKASDRLIDFAKESGYDAVIGIRFLAVSYDNIMIYGTGVRFARYQGSF